VEITLENLEPTLKLYPNDTFSESVWFFYAYSRGLELMFRIKSMFII
jgi:hypothetical protein